MAQKAILITAGNVNALSSRYDADSGTGPELAIGYYLVVNFGDHFGYELMSAARFFAHYNMGERLHTPEWFEAVLKIPQGGS